MERATIHGHGLDPALGVFHAVEDGRWSLALGLFSHAILNASHFENRDGGVFLNEEGRKKFFLQYERRMERQFMSECAGCRTTIRQQLEQQAVMFKSALTDPARFEPFLMN